MKHTVNAVVAVALGLGLATAAQAYGTNPQGAAPARQTQATAPDQMQRSATVGRHLSREQIKEAQQQLKSQGLFKGRIDGVMNHRTRLAIGHFQRQNGLPRTANLDQRTFDRLMGGGTQGLGVGSSMPAKEKSMQSTPRI